MKYKKVISILIIVIGLGFLGYALNAKHNIQNVKSDIETFSKPSYKNKFEKETKKCLEQKNFYNKQVKILFFMRRILVLIVTNALIIFTKKKK